MQGLNGSFMILVRPGVAGKKQISLVREIVLLQNTLHVAWDSVLPVENRVCRKIDRFYPRRIDLKSFDDRFTRMI